MFLVVFVVFRTHQWIKKEKNPYYSKTYLENIYKHNK